MFAPTVNTLGVTNTSELVPLKFCCGFIPLRCVNVARFSIDAFRRNDLRFIFEMSVLGKS